MPQASVAVHVRVKIVSWSQLPGAVLSLWLITGAGSQLSLAEATPVLLESVAIAAKILIPMQSAAAAVSRHSSVVLAGQVIVGAVLSITEIT